MLVRESDLRNVSLRAQDGEIGRCKDFLFDDAQWVLRYMEANTGKWLFGRRVLVSPLFLGEPDLDNKLISVRLKKEDIESAPSTSEDEPISDQFERAYYGYYGYPYYWVGGDVWGLHGYPADLLAEAAYMQRPEPEQEQKIRQSHLRSMDEVTGYSIHATDEEIGHVDDFVLDTKTWALRYLVVDVRRWLPGPSVLLSPQWIDRVSWHEKSVYVDMDKEAIKTAPRVEGPITEDDELAVFNHFSRRPYWHGSQDNNSPQRGVSRPNR